jgi:hypothetical protein
MTKVENQKSTYQRQLKGSRLDVGASRIRDSTKALQYRSYSSSAKDRLQLTSAGDEIDLKFGFERFKEVNGFSIEEHH